MTHTCSWPVWWDSSWLCWFLACHILECSDGLAQDVISTIGQAFDLRFQLYLQCPSSKPSSMHDKWVHTNTFRTRSLRRLLHLICPLFRVMSTDEPPWTEEGEESADHHYYNSIPGKMPPPGGFIDARLTNQTQDSSQVCSTKHSHTHTHALFIPADRKWPDQ